MLNLGIWRSWSWSLTSGETQSTHEKLHSIPINQWLLNTVVETKNELLFILGLQTTQSWFISSQQSYEVDFITFINTETEAQKVKWLDHDFSTSRARIQCLYLFSCTRAILFVVHESSYSAHIFWTWGAITIVLFPFGFFPVVAWGGSGLRHVEITGSKRKYRLGLP